MAVLAEYFPAVGSIYSGGRIRCARIEEYSGSGRISSTRSKMGILDLLHSACTDYRYEFGVSRSFRGSWKIR